MSGQKHIIHRQVYEITAGSQADPRDLQSGISELHHRQISQALADAFDDLIPEVHYLRIERLELDVGDLGQVDWRAQLAPRIKDLLKEKIPALATTAASRSASASALSPESPAGDAVYFKNKDERTLELFFFFLKHGRLPWWWPEEEKLELKQILPKPTLLNRKETKQRLRQMVAGHTTRSIKRLVEHFSIEDIRNLILVAFSTGTKAEREALQFATTSLRNYVKGRTLGKTAVTREFYKQLITQLAQAGPAPAAGPKLNVEILAKAFVASLPPSERPVGKRLFEIVEKTGATAPSAEAKAFTSSLRKLLKGKKQEGVVTKSREKPDPETSKRQSGPPFFKEEEETGIPVVNAGVVLLYPYFRQFFAEEKLLDKNNHFRNQASKLRAIHLVHYLCTGQKANGEHELTLPKILCGWPLEEAPELSFRLGRTTRDRLADLLQSAVKNWSALKSTSPEGLRQAFLQREGLLYLGEEKCLLRIERQTQDILLDRLPYTLSMFKLPWLHHMIYVEW